MTIAPFFREDLDHFMSMAHAERWMVDAWEFDFLLGAFPQGCFCARDKADRVTGFVTSLRHDRSGWIGNLIVSPGSRGSGIGKRLFLKAREALYEAGVQTIWLTASKAGRPLYEKHGFSSIDTIQRWSGFGKQQPEGHNPELYCNDTTSSVSGIDFQAWDDRRDLLLAGTIGRGRLLLIESAFLVIQPCGDARQFGPFSSLDSSMTEIIFENALCTVPQRTKVYLDAPESNRSTSRLFNRSRMRITGTNELMFEGKKPGYRPEYLFGLATMGSCG